MRFLATLPSLILIFLCACNNSNKTTELAPLSIEENQKSRLDIYKEVTLNTDLSHLSKQQKQMLGLLIEASQVIDELYWLQNYGEDKDIFLARIKNLKVRKFAEINYGPWDRLNNETVFIKGEKEKLSGANFYPYDMQKSEFETSQFFDKKGLYSIVSRNHSNELMTIAYSEYYEEQLNRVAIILEKSALLAENQKFSQYLTLRAEALRSDNYQASDLAWMDMKDNLIDVVIGPIETYEDRLYGYRAAFESYVLIKDLAWSKKLSKYAKHLNQLQKSLPVDRKYKREKPGNKSDLNVYDAIYFAGQANAGSKTIAINLPNDEEVQLAKGTRRLQLKNSMQAKFDEILVPIANQLIIPEQRNHVTFNAFFTNTMFHEIAHGLGIKKVVKSKETVREALKEHASALEEGKADVLGLFMIRELYNKKVLTEGELADYYVTFMTSVFRSVRFGASSAHGKANMIRFNYFMEKGAFTRNEQGLYEIHMKKMTTAVKELSRIILTLQGKGDYKGTDELIQKSGHVNSLLQQDLVQLEKMNIPVDIYFKQGKEVLKL